MKRVSDNLVVFSPDEVAEMLRERLRAAGVTESPVGVQVIVERPFSADVFVHNEVPGLNVLLSQE